MRDTFPLVDGVNHHFVNVNGVKLHIAEAGIGFPVILLHGWPQHWYLWRRQIPQLSKNFRVICPDLRGFGWSDAPPSGYAKEQLVDDLLRLLDALGLQQVYLAGHDWGGWVGFLLCLRAPERIKGFLALNIPHPFQKLDGRARFLWRFWYQVVIASPFIGKWVVQRTKFVEGLLKSGKNVSPLDSPTLAAFADRLRISERANASVQVYRTFLLRELLPLVLGRYRTQQLKVPTRVIFGMDDLAIAPQLLDGYEPYALDMQVEMVPGCGHFIVDEQPDLVTDRLLAFFEAEAMA